MSGRLITFEGGEGSGKTTQHQLLIKRLKKEGVPLLDPPPREPGGTKLGEEIRKVVLDPSNTELSPLTELLLFETARSQMMHEKVRPALERGLTVVLDRFYDSTVAYQGYGRGLDQGMIRTLNGYATQGIVPDLTFVFDVDTTLGLARATKGGADRMESVALAFHERVREGYLQIAKEEPERVVVLDGARYIEELHRQVLGHYNSMLGR